jgi:AcrR family transcriptional regulator/DNA-binding MarR family transcriptional regulator
LRAVTAQETDDESPSTVEEGALTGAGSRNSHVARIQRARIVSAMVEVCRERGAADVAVAHVVARAGVSRRTFYELFDGCESCLLSALDEATSAACKRVCDAYDVELLWRERIRAALAALLSFLDEEPALAHLLMVGSHAAGRGAHERREFLLVHAMAALESVRRDAPHGLQPLPLTAEGILGAVLLVLERRIVDGRDGPLSELTNSLMSMIVLPYLGTRAAHAELKRTVVLSEPTSRPKRGSLNGLDIRLTYRTIRVLEAIAARPGCSNREVGRAAGAVDAGQISKLLRRLQGLGLVENREGRQPKGTPNAWFLTGKGAEVERAIAAHAAVLRA